MKDTGFWMDTSKADRITQIFTYDAEKRLIAAPAQGPSTVKPMFLSGSGGLLSTTEDYFKFARRDRRMLADGTVGVPATCATTLS